MISNNRNYIYDIKNSYSYFNNSLCGKILGFKSSFSIIDPTCNEYNNINNHFTNKNDDKLIFNNLCIASNLLLNEKTKDITFNNKIKQCPICNKWFEPDENHKIYDTDICKKKGKNNKEKLNKRKRRNNSQ